MGIMKHFLGGFSSKALQVLHSAALHMNNDGSSCVKTDMERAVRSSVLSRSAPGQLLLGVGGLVKLVSVGNLQK